MLRQVATDGVMDALRAQRRDLKGPVSAMIGVARVPLDAQRERRPSDLDKLVVRHLQGKGGLLANLFREALVDKLIAASFGIAPLKANALLQDHRSLGHIQLYEIALR